MITGDCLNIQGTGSMGDSPKTLDEIRSGACNAILLALTVLAALGGGASVLRAVEQGWKPIMGVHIALVLVLIAATFGRHHLTLSARATIVTAVPFIIAVGGIVAYGRGNGAMMFFISSCVLAGCFFSRRAALGVVGLCVSALAAIYIGDRLGILDLPTGPATYDMSIISWLALGVGLVTAAAAPIIGLSALLQSLDAERRRADEAARVRADFLAHMSHELRTPMGGLIGMAEVLKGTRLDDHQQAAVATLLRAGRNLLTVLNDVLDFSKFETGNVPIEKRPFRISESIRNTCAPFETAAAQKGLGLIIEIPARLQDEVIGDDHRISHVLSNLIDNAIKFTAQGIVTVRVAQEPRADGDLTLLYAVSDTGIGLSAAQIDRIFEPFVQADASTSRKYGGSGLGLAICRKLVEAMGGDISVTSHLGTGATFAFQVPVSAAAATPHNQSKTPPLIGLSDLNAPRPDGNRTLHLLVAEDDPHMQTLVDIMLPRMGYVVTVVHDGVAAVAAARAHTYDCIVMDMHMPVMDGPEAMRAIHAAEAEKGLSRRTPIIALTADLISDHVRGFLEAGADVVVAKPVDWSILDARIQALAGERVSTAEPA